MNAGPKASAGMSQLQQTVGSGLKQATGAAPGCAVLVIATRNTVTGTITSMYTNTTTLPVKGLPWTAITLTLQPVSGGVVTLTADDNFPGSRLANLQAANTSVTVALDASGAGEFAPSCRRARPRFRWP